MTAMPNTTEPDMFDLIELDLHHDSAPSVVLEQEGPEVELEPYDQPTVAQQMTIDGEVTADAVAEFGGIASESARNAAAATQAFGSIRRVTAENAVSGVTHGAETGDSGARLGIFERPAAERRFIVGQSANEADAVLQPGKLESGQVVAGAVAEGNGVLVGWHGDRQITRAVLLEALRGIGREDWAPKPKDARAQAGRAMAAAGSRYHVKADRKGAITAHEGATTTGQHRWRLGQIDGMGQPGDKYGATVAVMTLSPEGRLTGLGNQAVIDRIVEDYTARCASELYVSADLTTWLTDALVSHCGAVDYAVGMYIPARHRDAAIALCNAVSATGWGNSWLGGQGRPALPIATCDELRDGLARGLKDEVAQVLAKLHGERESARIDKLTRRAAAEAITGEAGVRARESADALAGDIGPTRAGTFLKELRAIAVRVAAYSQLLGEERCDSAGRAVHDAVRELEGLVDEANSGIVQRFALIFDEMRDEARRSGAVL